MLQCSQLEKRLDPNFYLKMFKENVERIKKGNFKKLSDLVSFSSETWNQKDLFEETFPYIEISEVDTLTGEILNISLTEKDKAPSRAKMIVRENDIIISTTRPNRGVVGNQKCRVFGNQECRVFGNNEYTKNGNKDAEQVSKLRELFLVFKNCFSIFQPVAFPAEVNHFALEQ